MPSPRSRPRCSSGAERSEPKPTSNCRGTSGSGERASSRMSCSRSRRRLCSSSRRSSSVISIFTPPSAPSRHSPRNSSASSSCLLDAVAPDRARQAGVEAVQRRCARPTRAASRRPWRSIWRGEIRRSKNHADEQSAKRSSSVTLNGVFAPSSASTRGCRSLVSRVKARAGAPAAAAPSRSRPRAPRPRPARSTASWASARRRSRSVGAASSSQVSCESGRRRVQRAHVVGVEERDDLVPERARLARIALVGRRLADEREPAGRARAGRVEEVALALDRIGPRRAARDRRSSSPRTSSSRKGDGLPRRGSVPSSRPSRKTVSKRRVRARARSSTATRPRSPARAEPDLGVLERGQHLVRGQLAAERPPAVELVQEHARPRRRPAGRRGPPRRRAAPRGRGRRAASSAASARTASTGPAALAQRLERRQRLPVAQLDRLLLHALAGGDAAAAQAALEEVDVRAREARERRAEERVEIAAAALLPFEAEQREQRLAERRLAQPDAALDREGDAERAEHGLERRPPALDRRDDERDLLQRRARARRARESPPRRARASPARPRPRRSGSRPRAAARPAASSAKSWRSRCASAAWPYSAERAGSSSIRPPASEARSSCVRRSDANAARPGSYGSETVTSVRPESASSSPHSAPVRSSNP